MYGRDGSRVAVERKRMGSSLSDAMKSIKGATIRNFGGF